MRQPKTHRTASLMALPDTSRYRILSGYGTNTPRMLYGIAGYRSHIYATFSTLFASVLVNGYVCASHLILIVITYANPKPIKATAHGQPSSEK